MGGIGGSAGRLMVSDDGRESEPMIAFHEQNTDEAALGHLPVRERVCVCICVCVRVPFLFIVLLINWP